MVDIGIKDGHISTIAAHIRESAALELDVQGQLVSPPFVDSHIHIDSVLTAVEPRWNVR